MLWMAINFVRYVHRRQHRVVVRQTIKDGDVFIISRSVNRESK